MQNVLIVEDEKRFREILKDYFEFDGFNVYEAENGREALAKFDKYAIDLVVLDIMMPELDGFSVCRKIRLNNSVPIIIITARGEDDDQLHGFDLGADDYVIKPFSPKVLIARAKQLLKRVSQNEGTSTPDVGCDIIVRGHLELNKKSYALYLNDSPVDLAPKEYEILRYLMEHEGTVVSRQGLLDKIWGYDFYGDTRVIDTHIKKIRKKLKEEARHIHTVISVGYKFEVMDRD